MQKLVEAGSSKQWAYQDGRQVHFSEGAALCALGRCGGTASRGADSGASYFSFNGQVKCLEVISN